MRKLKQDRGGVNGYSEARDGWKSLRAFLKTLGWFVLVMFIFALILKSLDAPVWYVVIAIAGLSVVFVLVARRS